MARVDHGQELVGPAGRVTRALLRIPLFYKILLGNVAVLTVAGTAAVALAARIVGFPTGGDAVEFGVLLLLLAIPVAALLNGLIVRIALDPLARLEATADAVRRGRLEERVSASAVADRRLQRLFDVFNGMLDTLASAGRRQRELSQAVLEAQEHERQRLSHELYAGTAQTLAGVLVRLRVAARARTVQGDTLNEIRSEVARALDEVRVAARALRPPELDELGVQAALEAHARAVTEGRRIGFVFAGRIPDASLSRPARLALFRVLQEAVTNAVRHARASEVRVAVRLARDGVVALVRDDGRGFEPAEVERRAAGLGLVGMRERIRYVGGTVTVDSSPGRGTSVLVHVPWTVAAASGEVREGGSGAAVAAVEARRGAASSAARLDALVARPVATVGD